ncbi:MAG: (Fe-S)-binding protein [Spirochaetota bacterium]|nr:(Fe-S)-binding protein [Spirochaetota bacterium]
MIKNEYYNLSVSSPRCTMDDNSPWAIDFRLYEDISHLFPYINSIAPDSRYFTNPHYIRFSLDGKNCVLYPRSVIITPLEDRVQARQFIDRFFSFINDIEARMNFVEPDDSVFTQAPVIEIYKKLPGTNCGDCGYKTCMAFACAVGAGEIELACCKAPASL